MTKTMSKSPTLVTPLPMNLSYMPLLAELENVFAMACYRHGAPNGACVGL
jgi:hypothetical protein